MLDFIRARNIALAAGFAVGAAVGAYVYTAPAAAGPIADAHQSTVRPVRLEIRRGPGGECPAVLVEEAPLTAAAAAEDPEARPRSWRVSYVLPCAQVLTLLNAGCFEDDSERPPWVTAPARGTACPTP